MFYLTPFFQYWRQNCFLPLNFEEKDDPRLINSLYQTKYTENYEALKNDYKATLSSNISFVALKKYLSNPSAAIRYMINFIQNIFIIKKLQREDLYFPLRPFLL